jgi:hypothetical protein
MDDKTPVKISGKRMLSNTPIMNRKRLDLKQTPDKNNVLCEISGQFIDIEDAVPVSVLHESALSNACDASAQTELSTIRAPVQV